MSNVNITNTKSQELDRLKKDWKIFNIMFGAIFFLHAISYIALKTQTFSYGIISHIFFALQFITVIIMAALMSYYAFKFTGKKSSLFIGALGFFWFLLFGIFIGYWAVASKMQSKKQLINS